MISDVCFRRNAFALRNVFVVVVVVFVLVLATTVTVIVSAFKELVADLLNL
jgi:hypothetical protein